MKKIILYSILTIFLCSLTYAYNYNFSFSPQYINMSDTCKGEIGFPASNLTFCLNDGTSDIACSTFTYEINKTTRITANFTSSRSSFRLKFSWSKIKYNNMNNSALNGNIDSGQTRDYYTQCRSAGDFYVYSSSACTSNSGFTAGYPFWYNMFANSATCTGSKLISAEAGGVLAATGSLRIYDGASITGSNATLGTATCLSMFGTQSNSGNYQSDSNCMYGGQFSAGEYSYVKTCTTGTDPTPISSLCTYTQSTIYSSYIGPSTKNITISEILFSFADINLTIVDNVAPSFSNVGVNNSYPSLNNSVLFFSYWQDNLRLDSYIFSWNLSGAWINDTAISAGTKSCYQESANVSNQTGIDGSCGLNYNGYASPGNFNDGNYTTIISTTSIGAFPENFTKPTSVFAANLILYTATDNTPGDICQGNWVVTNKSTSIPSACLDYSPSNIVLYYNSTACSLSSIIRAWCYTGSSYTELDSYQTGAGCSHSSSSCSRHAWSESAILWTVPTDNVNATVIKLINQTANINSFSFMFFMNDSANNQNNTGLQTVFINKLLPTASVLLSPKPILSTQNLTANISFFDQEGDTWRANETIWYNNSVEVASLKNLTKINSSYFSDGQVWIVSARVFDGFNWSDWVNDTVTIADTGAPNINSFFPSSFTITSAESVILYTNVTDALSSVYPDACIYTIRKSDENLGCGFGQFCNQTTVAKTGDFVYLSVGGLNPGTLEWKSAFCSDSSGNTASNQALNISITITTTGGTPGGGGGGGGAATIVQVNFTEQEQAILGITCGNSVCDKNENPFNCQKDCGVNIDTLTSGSTFGQYWFVQALVIFIIGTIGVFMYRSSKQLSKR